MKVKLLRALVYTMLMLVFNSCATYNKSMSSYYTNIQEHNYEQALHSLKNNKLIKKDRNALLYNLEMGKIYRLQNNYVYSNLYLNAADQIIENNRKTIADIAVSNLLNPMHQTYLGEDHEQFMMHYYKALNYANIGNTEDAVVEARRITLSANTQNNKYKNKDNRYSNDAFALNLQGIIYEMADDINNAFISYRNAADIYIKNNNEYYGVKIPLQLQKDVLRTATILGFEVEQNQYKNEHNTSFIDTINNNGEVIIFLEEGQAPIKEEKNFVLTAGNNGINSFTYFDENGYSQPFNFNANTYGISNEKLTDIRAFKLSLPVYNIQYYQQQKIFVANNGKNYEPQLVQNINNIAINILKERFVTEMANAVARQVTKKLLEKGTEALAEGIARSTDKSEAKDTSQAAKDKTNFEKENRKNTAGNIAGLAVNIFNTITEKADTRNWQSLPAFVSYVRIPLQQGENNIVVTANGKEKEIKINAAKGLQIISITLDN
ncbi:MAG: hypothetical protein ABL929_10665 [Ferruginibacter sp.]|nr:hypothetical protein [Ferruginibacter sp.]